MRPTDLGRITPVFTVSIHASVKDATSTFFATLPGDGFNPRICKRCDVFLVLRLVALFGFNPRICKRCDITYFSSCCTPISFNPRICKRCDLLIGSRLLEALRFNPRICKRCDSMFVKSFIDDTFKL